MKKFVLGIVTTLTLLVCLWASLVFIVPSEAQGGVTGFANLRITNFYRAQPRTTIVITNAATLNSTGSYQRISAIGTAGTSGEAVTVKPAGTILFLVNVGVGTITFTESTHLKSAGNIVLGPTDTATLLSDGTFWTQMALSNN